MAWSVSCFEGYIKREESKKRKSNVSKVMIIASDRVRVRVREMGTFGLWLIVYTHQISSTYTFSLFAEEE